ncbi:MAG: DUF547 domain-containing protein [Actinomycetota bacterium]
MSKGPNPLRAGWNMVYALRLRTPGPGGSRGIDHTELASVLTRMREHGTRTLKDAVPDLAAYRDHVERTDPDTLSPDGALAYWINLYNAGALHRAGQAFSNDLDSVLRVPGAFSAPWATVARETLSLDDIEHGKIRRFGDPRIHGALVCGSVSCPTLRSEPFEAERLDAQLDDQMRSFLAGGGARLDRANHTLHVTRVLKWYGADFVRPSSMPTLIPARSADIAVAVSSWLSPEDALYVEERRPRVVFAPYDWALGCSIA